jgi:hypothetical protein
VTLRVHLLALVIRSALFGALAAFVCSACGVTPLPGAAIAAVAPLLFAASLSWTSDDQEGHGGLGSRFFEIHGVQPRTVAGVIAASTALLFLVVLLAGVDPLLSRVAESAGVSAVLLAILLVPRAWAVAD